MKKLILIFLIGLIILPAPILAQETPTAAPSTATPLPTDTAAPPTETPLPTDTVAPPTETPIPTDTAAPPTETPLPTDTAAPPTATLPTGDRYEPDNDPAAPSAIGLGDVQDRTFAPYDDVDYVQFLEVNGRAYVVATANLAVGVDTKMELWTSDGRYLSNDDLSASVLASRLEFVAQADGYTLVKITTNAGLYDATRGYQLSLTAGSLPATPTATRTETPVPLPTATYPPAYYDPYEPDDHAPAPCGIGETQLRTFDPQGDVDQITFMIKPGRFYRVYTADLAPNVDPILTLNLPDGRELINDDLVAGTLAAQVEFGWTQPDNYAVARVTQHTGHYGHEFGYKLIVVEYSPTATPPPPTTTPDARPDPYEPDSCEPGGIDYPIGTEFIRRAFNYQGDLDCFHFTAKNKRYYAIFTQNLAAGVDTMLWVYRWEGNQWILKYANDDWPNKPTTASYVEVRFGGEYHTRVDVQSRGNLSGDTATYELVIQEFLPTPRPTDKVNPTGTPQPTSTPQPTLTPWPTSTLIPTAKPETTSGGSGPAATPTPATFTNTIQVLVFVDENRNGWRDSMEGVAGIEVILSAASQVLAPVTQYTNLDGTVTFAYTTADTYSFMVPQLGYATTKLLDYQLPATQFIPIPPVMLPRRIP